MQLKADSRVFVTLHEESGGNVHQVGQEKNCGHIIICLQSKPNRKNDATIKESGKVEMNMKGRIHFLKNTHAELNIYVSCKMRE